MDVLRRECISTRPDKNIAFLIHGLRVLPPFFHFGIGSQFGCENLAEHFKFNAHNFRSFCKSSRGRAVSRLPSCATCCVAPTVAHARQRARERGTIGSAALQRCFFLFVKASQNAFSMATDTGQPFGRFLFGYFSNVNVDSVQRPPLRRCM